MLITNRSRKLVFEVPIGVLAVSVGLGLLSSTGKHPAGWKGWIIPGILVLAALFSFRVVRRVGRHIFILEFLLRKRLEVARTFMTVAVRTHYRGATNEVELVVDDTVNLVPLMSTSIASYSFADTYKAARAAQRIADALDIPSPRLPFSLPTAQTHAGPRRSNGLFRRSRWFNDGLIGLAVFGVGSAAVVQYSQRQNDAELYLRCRNAHAIKIPIGQLTLTGSTGFTLLPGETTVEVWNADLGCWAQRTLTLKQGVKTILDLDELAALRRCDRRGSPPP